MATGRLVRSLTCGRTCAQVTPWRTSGCCWSLCACARCVSMVGNRRSCRVALVGTAARTVVARGLVLLARRAQPALSIRDASAVRLLPLSTPIVRNKHTD